MMAEMGEEPASRDISLEGPCGKRLACGRTWKVKEAEVQVERMGVVG